MRKPWLPASSAYATSARRGEGRCSSLPLAPPPPGVWGVGGAAEPAREVGRGAREAAAGHLSRGAAAGRALHSASLPAQGRPAGGSSSSSPPPPRGRQSGAVTVTGEQRVGLVARSSYRR